MTSKFALVIANTEYQDASFAKLNAPGKDAEEFAQVLRDTECAAFDDVQVLLNEGEGKIRRSIARFFAERKRDDLLLLYFSGHGVRNEVGHLFLAANDTEIKILEASGIPAEFVTNSMNNSRSQRQLLILDCCNSGAFAHGSKSASGVGKSMGIATAFEGSGFGRVVLTATDATQYAWEGDKVIGDTQKSVFTHFLIEGLKGDADLDSDGRIDVDELYDYAYEEVVRRTPKQTPGKWSYKQQGDIILRENLKPREVKPAPLPPELLEMLAHPNSGVRRAGLQELIGLLDGKHQGLARAAREKLLEIAENDDSLTLRRSVSDALKARGFVLEEVIEQSDFYPFQQSPLPVSVETPKEEQREEKKIEKPPIVQPRNLPEQKMVAPNFNLRLIGGIVGGLLIIGFLIWGMPKLLQNSPVATPESTSTFQTTVMPASQPATTITFQPQQTNTPSPSQTSIPPASTLDIGSTLTGKDGMTLLYVPAGEFTMGNDNNYSDEKPVHQVNLDAFWIDETEVTNRMYSLCVSEGACNEPISKTSYSRSSYYGNSEFDNYPVIYVNWNMAKTYCAWADRRLPSEAEWEKAARGDDGRTFPWGNARPNRNWLNFYNTIGDTTKVGQYPEGASPYGVLDMAGNVWEWVADWYGSYANSPTSNPLGPDSGTLRVFRGGSWTDTTYRYEYSGPYLIDTSYAIESGVRAKDAPIKASSTLGFRCAMSATP